MCGHSSTGRLLISNLTALKELSGKFQDLLRSAREPRVFVSEPRALLKSRSPGRAHPSACAPLGFRFPGRALARLHVRSSAQSARERFAARVPRHCKACLKRCSDAFKRI